jgi:hypothetical protein
MIVFAISLDCSAQVSSAISPSGYVSISKDPPKPPYLEINNLSFQDSDGNMKIDANEETLIYFDLLNSGTGPGLNLQLSIIENMGIKNLQFERKMDIGSLGVGESKLVQIPIKAGMSLPNGRASFIIKVDEANGFDSDKAEIEIQTKAFKAPNIKVVDYKVSSVSSNTLQKRRPFDLQVLIQNVGEGRAEDIHVDLPIPNGMFCLSANEFLIINELGAGEQYLIEYSLVTNNEYSKDNIPIDIKISEKYSKYAQNKDIVLAMNQGVSSKKLVVKGNVEKERSFAIASLSSKIDKNIPVNTNKNPNRIALVIGNEDYSRTLNAEVNVEFARNDAETFKQYALNTMGVEKRNMHFLVDATAGQMQREIDLVAAILKQLGPKGELIFYYAGHGFPDERTKTPYIIPVDVDATNLRSAIKLSDIYQEFGNTTAAKVTIFLDACFTGGGRNQGLLAARGVAIKPKTEMIRGNTVVFSAASGEQSALPYFEQGHGMFTYFLLEKIQESEGNITYGELSNYLSDKLGIESLRENGKPQNPEVNVSRNIIDGWEEWRF